MNHTDTALFTEFELDYLDEQPFGRLATSRPDGTLQVSPVGFGVNRALGTIDIGGYDMANTRKYRNVADTGRVAFVVDDVVSLDPRRVRFLEIRGRGEAVAEPDGSGHGGRPGAIIRIHPERILTFALHPGDRDTDASRVRVRSRGVTGTPATEGA